MKKQIKNIYKKVKEINPLKNKTTLEDGTTIKWKIKPHWKKDKIKASLEVNKSIDDVELYAKVEGKVYRIYQDGLSRQDDEIFKCEFGATKTF